MPRPAVCFSLCDSGIDANELASRFVGVVIVGTLLAKSGAADAALSGSVDAGDDEYLRGNGRGHQGLRSHDSVQPQR